MNWAVAVNADVVVQLREWMKSSECPIVPKPKRELEFSENELQEAMSRYCLKEKSLLFLDKAKLPASFAADVDPEKAAFMADSQAPWGMGAYVVSDLTTENAGPDYGHL